MTINTNLYNEIPVQMDCEEVQILNKMKGLTFSSWPELIFEKGFQFRMNKEWGLAIKCSDGNVYVVHKKDMETALDYYEGGFNGTPEPKDQEARFQLFWRDYPEKSWLRIHLPILRVASSNFHYDGVGIRHWPYTWHLEDYFLISVCIGKAVKDIEELKSSWSVKVFPSNHTNKE